MDQFTSAELTRLMDYFAQALDPDEMVLVERWIEEQTDRRRLVDDLKQSRIDLGRDNSTVSWNLPSRVDAMAHTLAAIWTDEPVTHPPIALLPRAQHAERNSPRWLYRSHLPRVAWYTLGTLAASVLLIVSGWYIGQRDQLQPSMAMYTYTTGKGERATITLPDGSTILMNVASRIDVPANYAAGNRTIQLSGEGLFTVAHHEHAPFTVVAGTSTTRVLGTSFIVRHYPTDTAATVAVRDGKVAVGSVILTSAQQVTVGMHGIGSVQPVDFDLFGFATGVMTLKRMSLVEAIPELNRWYDVAIHLADPTLDQERIEGQFARGSVAELGEFLEWTFGFRVVRAGRELTLYRK